MRQTSSRLCGSMSQAPSASSGQLVTLELELRPWYFVPYVCSTLWLKNQFKYERETRSSYKLVERSEEFLVPS
jgi:hypothetical protein